jgi:hypothetical protein
LPANDLTPRLLATVREDVAGFSPTDDWNFCGSRVSTGGWTIRFDAASQSVAAPTERISALVAMEEGGNTLDDVDVLAIDVAPRTLLALECKNLDFARTRCELWSEVREFEDPKHGIFFKHGRRATWMRAHMPDVLRGLGLSGAGWRAEPVIVLRSDMIAVHLRPMAMRTIDASDLALTLRGAPRVPPRASATPTERVSTTASPRPAVSLGYASLLVGALIPAPSSAEQRCSPDT